MARSLRASGTERYRSGQTGQTVNLLAMPSEVRILPSPPRRLLSRWSERSKPFASPTDRRRSRSTRSQVFGSDAVAHRTLLGSVSKARRTSFEVGASLDVPVSWTAGRDVRVDRAGVAQLARARAFQARGRGFEPRLPLQVAGPRKTSREFGLT